MNITMQNLERLSLAEMKEFVEGNRKVRLSTETREETSLGGGHCTVTRILFRLTLYWNQLPISGSFYDWKMLSSGCATRKWRPARFIDKRLESKRRCTQEVRRFVGSLEKPRPIDHPFIYDLW